MSFGKVVGIMFLIIVAAAVALVFIILIVKPGPNETVPVPDGAIHVEFEQTEPYTGTYEFLPPQTPQLPKAHCIGVRKDENTVLVVCEVQDPLPE